VDKCSFESFCQVPPTETIALKFLSPTSFKQSQTIQPFPLPELVFGNLLRRWNIFAPVELQFPNLEWQGVVSAYNLKTRTLSLNGTAEIGTTGWVRYRFNDPEQAKVATILAHFAEFAGVGRKTAMGMGQVCIP
jgi:CRISPR-associated endoribonuclease Cas6